MDAIITPASSVSGTIVVPADKAICHRAALLCALVDGSTRISPWSEAVDCQQTLALVRQFGVTVTDISQGIRVHGVGRSGLRPPAAALECGESGTSEPRPHERGRTRRNRSRLEHSRHLSRMTLSPS